MHYIKRVVLVLLFLLLVVAAIPVALVALHIPVDLHVLKRPLVRAASEQLGVDVRIDGDMRLIPGLEPTLEMGGLMVTDPRSPEAGNRIELGFARVQLALVPLVFGEIRIEDLTAEDIRAIAILDGDLAPSSETPDVAGPSPAPSESESTLVFSGLANLGLRRISVEVRSRASGKRYRLVLDELTGAATAGKPLTLAAHGAFQDEPFRLSMSGETLDKLLLLKWSWPLAMRAEIAGMGLVLTPAAAPATEATGEAIDYSLRITGRRLDDLDRIAGVSLPPLGPYAVGGRFTVSPDRYSISEFELRVRRSSLQGSFHVDAAGAPPRLAVDLSAESVYLADFDVGDWSPVEANPKEAPAAAADAGSRRDTTQSVVAMFDPNLLERFAARLSLSVGNVIASQGSLGGGSLTARLEDGIITLDPVRVVLPRGPIELAMTLDPGSAPEAPGRALLPTTISARLAQTALRLDRVDEDDTLTEQATPSLSYRMQVEGQRLDGFDPFVGVSMPPLGPYTLSTLITVRENHFALRDLEVRVGESDLEGSMSIDVSGDRPRARITLATDVLQLDDFIFDNWSMVDPTDGTPGDDAQASRAIESESIDALLSREAMTLIDAELAVQVSRVRLGAEDLGGGNLGVRLENGRLDVHPIHLNIPGGSLDMALTLEPGEEALFASARTDIEHFDYGVLARRAKPDTDMGGRISLDMAMQARAERAEDLMREANGHMLLGIWPDNIEADVFDLWTVNLLIAIMPTVDEGPRSRVNCVIAGVEFADGVATQTSLLMDTTNMQVGGEVRADFRTEKIDVYLKPSAKVPQFFSLATPVQVDGSFSDFGVAPAPGALVGTVIRMLTSIVTVPVQRLFQEEIPEDGEAACAIAFRGGIPEGR